MSLLFLLFILFSLPLSEGKAVLQGVKESPRFLSEEDTWQTWEIILASGSAGVALLLLIYACLMRSKNTTPVSTEVVRIKVNEPNLREGNPASLPLKPASNAAKPAPAPLVKPPPSTLPKKTLPKKEVPKKAPQIQRRASAPTKGMKRSSI